jgi:single-stranded DNA-binding protein
MFVSVMYFGGDCTELAAKATKGTGIYVEGRLSLDRWEKDGEQRTGLSVMSGHCRVAAIGRNKPERAERRSQHAPPHQLSTTKSRLLPSGDNPSWSKGGSHAARPRPSRQRMALVSRHS